MKVFHPFRQMMAVVLSIILLMTAQPLAKADWYDDLVYRGNMYISNCEEWVSLRTEPDSSAYRIENVGLGEVVEVYEGAGNDEFAYCIYDGVYGYIMRKYLSREDPFGERTTFTDLSGSKSVPLADVDYLAMSHLAYSNWKHGNSIGSVIDKEKPLRTGTSITYGQLCKNILDWKVLLSSKDYGGLIKSEGFYAVVFYNEQLRQAVVSYRGSSNVGKIFSSSDAYDDWLENDIPFQLSHEISPQLEEALIFYDLCCEELELMGNYEITLTGHSLGGALAHTVSMTYGVHAVTFNPASVYEALYKNKPEEMAKMFEGTDKWNFVAHINENDNLVGKWDKEYKYAPHKVYESTPCESNVALWEHSLPSLIHLEGEEVDMNTDVVEAAFDSDIPAFKMDYGLTTNGRPGGRAPTIRKNEGTLYLGTSKDDHYESKKYPNVFYGGLGNDSFITNGAIGNYRSYLIGGGGDDTFSYNEKITVTRKNDCNTTYIYYNGDGYDTIIDAAGKDVIKFKGFDDIKSFTAELQEDWIIISYEGDELVRVQGDRLDDENFTCEIEAGICAQKTLRQLVEDTGAREEESPWNDYKGIWWAELYGDADLADYEIIIHGVEDGILWFDLTYYRIASYSNIAGRIQADNSVIFEDEGIKGILQLWDEGILFETDNHYTDEDLQAYSWEYEEPFIFFEVNSDHPL